MYTIRDYAQANGYALSPATVTETVNADGRITATVVGQDNSDLFNAYDAYCVANNLKAYGVGGKYKMVKMFRCNAEWDFSGAKLYYANNNGGKTDWFDPKDPLKPHLKVLVGNPVREVIPFLTATQVWKRTVKDSSYIEGLTGRMGWYITVSADDQPMLARTWPAP